ncbi:MAG: hypothetical protein JWM19_872 [Actinomycetia bacterium]|nr:hypothetical protein [Actinomycetes bacterium]
MQRCACTCCHRSLASRVRSGSAIFRIARAWAVTALAWASTAGSKSARECSGKWGGLTAHRPSLTSQAAYGLIAVMSVPIAWLQ